MVDGVKSPWRVMVILFALFALSLVTACGGDDDDGSAQAGTGGYPAAGSTGYSGYGGSTGAGTGGTAGGPMDSGTVDGAPPTPTGTVEEGGSCTFNLLIFSATGVCLPSTASCPGGFASQADCVSGLQCCIDTDQCETIGDSLGFGDSINCVPEGTCSSAIPITQGCPAGQECCVEISFEGGLPGLDGGFPMPNVDGGGA